jgi:ribonuclease P protein component
VLPTENRLRRRQDFAAAVRRGRRAGRPLMVVHLRTATAASGGVAAGHDAECASQPGPAQPADTRHGDPYAPGGTPPPARAGFVVSKAVGHAVVRNRVKRRLRHLMRERLPLLPPGSLIVIRALPDAGAAEHGELARDLDAALRRLLPAKAGGAT